MQLGIFLLLIAARAAFGFQLVSEDAIHDAVEEYVRSEIPAEPGAELDVRVRWQGEVALDCDGPVGIQVRSISALPFRGQTMVRAALRCDGATRKSIAVTVDTRLNMEVLVAKRHIRRHEILSAEMVELAIRDITGVRGGYFTTFEGISNNRSKRPVALGAVLSADHVEQVPAIFRGDEVELVAVSSGIWVSASGVAIQDGSIGNRIRVRNRDSGRIVQGTVLNSGTVDMGL